MKRKYLFILLASITMLAMLLPGASVSAQEVDWNPVYTTQTHLDPTTIDQFASPLPVLAAAGGSIETIVAGTSQLEIDIKEFKANVLPDSFTPSGGDTEYAGTWVWGYVTPSADTENARDTYTGPAVVATRGTPTEIKFVNELGTVSDTHALAYKYAIDESLHWASPLGADKYVNIGTEEAPIWVGNPVHYDGLIPAAVHLHGAEDPAAVDGGPDSWFTNYADTEGKTGALHGPAFYSKDIATNTDGNYSIYTYPNSQEAAPLWFHDHTLGATRLNVYMGIAGAYALIDPDLKLPAGLTALGLDRNNDGSTTGDEYLVPLVVQDRMFDTNGQLFYNNSPMDADPQNYAINPQHAYWTPEFFGDTVAVNGKVWPYLNVDAQRYLFSLINGSNARTWELTFQGNSGTVPTIWQIATDGGYLDNPVAVDPLVIMPGERAEFVVDFSGAAGTSVVLNNIGPDEPFDGVVGSQSPSNPATTGKVMQFNVSTTAVTDKSYNPAVNKATIRTGADKLIRLVDPTKGTLAKNVIPGLTRELTLVEVANDNPSSVNGIDFEGGPLEVLVNNTKWMGTRPDESDPNMMGTPIDGFTPDGIGKYLSELPSEGTTEVWEIVNTTADAHPIHTHLAQFQLMNRQAFTGDPDTRTGYYGAYDAAFPDGAFIPAYGPPLAYNPSTASGGKYGGNPDVTPFLSGAATPPNPNEAGWKDTVMSPPGTVTRFVVRWAPTDIPVQSSASPILRYAFTPNDSIPGTNGAIYDYVWHCHIVDHEDNEMMRPDAVVPRPYAYRTFIMGEDY